MYMSLYCKGLAACAADQDVLCSRGGCVVQRS
jgi:hypothetical protein